MTICAEFAGRDKSTCTRGIACVCKKESEKTKNTKWIECSLCDGVGKLHELDESWECHQCGGEGGSWN